ncbi:Crp/Fnr family transcriptional regulator [Wandonia haliotis]|uniref:Crp/Fnr family transcriptional regulator n=1 Tax=Wandonia haliotis TaxID=574963 RepID=A0ABN1MUK0_9FLAO
MVLPDELFKSVLKDDVKNSGVVKTFEPGDVILNEESFIRSIPIVLDGSLKVMRTDPDGREILLYYIKPGESCIMSFLGGLHQEMSKVKAVAEEKTQLLLIPVDKAGEWIKEHPEWTDFMFRLYHRRFEELLEMVNLVAFQKLDQRLEHLILQKSNLYNNKEISITHQQLADELGTTREVVSRILKQMETKGMIKLGRNKIVLQ